MTKVILKFYQHCYIGYILITNRASLIFSSLGCTFTSKSAAAGNISDTVTQCSVVVCTSPALLWPVQQHPLTSSPSQFWAESSPRRQPACIRPAWGDKSSVLHTQDISCLLDLVPERSPRHFWFISMVLQSWSLVKQQHLKQQSLICGPHPDWLHLRESKDSGSRDQSGRQLWDKVLGHSGCLIIIRSWRKMRGQQLLFNTVT